MSNYILGICHTGCCEYMHDVIMILCAPSIKCTLYILYYIQHFKCFNYFVIALMYMWPLVDSRLNVLITLATKCRWKGMVIIWCACVRLQNLGNNSRTGYKATIDVIYTAWQYVSLSKQLSNSIYCKTRHHSYCLTVTVSLSQQLYRVLFTNASVNTCNNNLLPKPWS